MAGRDTLVSDDVDFRDEWEPDDELPPRPRKRALTSLGVGLLAVVLAAGAFIAGVEVQKGRQPASSGGGAAPTFGTVANKHGSTLYVRSSSGTTLRVTTAHAKVTRTAGTSVNGVYPGDTVIIQGTTHANGSISATQIRATAKGAGGAGGFGGGGGPGG
jgi:hypothetical protein